MILQCGTTVDLSMLPIINRSNASANLHNLPHIRCMTTSAICLHSGKIIHFTLITFQMLLLVTFLLDQPRITNFSYQKIHTIGLCMFEIKIIFYTTKNTNCCTIKLVLKNPSSKKISQFLTTNTIWRPYEYQIMILTRSFNWFFNIHFPVKFCTKLYTKKKVLLSLTRSKIILSKCSFFSKFLIHLYSNSSMSYVRILSNILKVAANL